MIIDILKKIIPFELKRGTSIVSIIIALIITGILTKLVDFILSLIIKGLLKLLPSISEKLLYILQYEIKINILVLIIGIVLFIIILFPIYRKVDKFILKKKKRELIFDDDFLTDMGWTKNYWGSTNKSKTNRIENSYMIFEATQNEWPEKGYSGAYYDITNGIFNGNVYEVSCFVKSDNKSTMEFQLWLHNIRSGPDYYEVKYPDNLFIPTAKGIEIKLNFNAISSNAMRIHLHCKGGIGRILVDYVKVHKIQTYETPQTV